MIFKVLYQESEHDAPVREATKSMYIEADEVKDVRKKLADHPYNIENVIPLSEDHLAYEKQSPDFKVESI